MTIPYEAYARPAKVVPTPLQVPAPTIAQRRLEWDKVATQRTFPPVPKRLWKAAADAGLWVRATYAVGPLVGAGKILEPTCPSIVVWIKKDGRALQATWLQRNGKWSFKDAILRGGGGWLNAMEAMKWVTG